MLILNCNSFAKAAAFHPEAVYRINIDNNGDAETDVALSLGFSEPRDGRQLATVYLATGPEARKAEPTGEQIFKDVEVSFGPEPNVTTWALTHSSSDSVAMLSSSTSKES